MPSGTCSRRTFVLEEESLPLRGPDHRQFQKSFAGTVVRWIFADG